MKNAYKEYRKLRDKLIGVLEDDKNIRKVKVEFLFECNLLSSSKTKEIINKIGVQENKLIEFKTQLQQIKFLKTKDIETFLNIFKKVQKAMKKNTENIDALQNIITRKEKIYNPVSLLASKYLQ